MSLLNETVIQSHLNALNYPHALGIHIFSSIDSTNRYLKELPKRSGLDVCCAETQTQGRGRFNRPWFSPYAQNVYCSSRWSLKQDISNVSTLSLLVSLAIMQTLQHWTNSSELSIKWPNDLMWQNKKLCGILIESSQHSTGEYTVVIGIGINVNMMSDDPNWQSEINKPWCSLCDITGYEIDRNELIARLIYELDQHLKQFVQEGFEPFRAAWAHWDYLHGKPIEVIQAGETIVGIAQGITPNGQLIVVDDQMHMHYCSSGETSISTTT